MMYIAMHIKAITSLELLDSEKILCQINKIKCKFSGLGNNLIALCLHILWIH